MWLRRIWTRIRDTVVKKFSEWVDKECPLIEDEDDSVGEKTIKEVVDKSLLEESIISSLEKANKERVVKVKKRQGRYIWEVSPATFGKRIRDATLHTFIYHYIFAAKSKSLII